jgi:hypothetical protein
MMTNKVPTVALIMIATLSVGIVSTIAISYLVYPGYLDTGEPNIVALAWRLLDGHPVYLPVDDAIRTSNVYGPYLYLIHSAVFAVLGGSVLIGKLPGISALAIALVLVAFAHRGQGKIAVSLALAYCAGIAGSNLPMTIWDRPETFMLACVAAGVCLNNLEPDQRGKQFRIVGFGVLIGVLMGLKAFAPIYFLPFGLLMLFRDGIIACILTVIIALVVIAIPFMFDVFRPQHVIELVQMLSAKPNSWDGLIKVLRYSLYYIVPALVFVIPMLRNMNQTERRESLLLLAGFLVANVLVFYPAQKPGAGMYYLMPFAPIVAALIVRGLASSSKQGGILWTGVVLALLVNILAIPVEKRLWRALEWQMAKEVGQEIGAITSSHPDKKIEIGIGSERRGYRKTFQRTRLVFDGHPYTLDASIIIETAAWGIDIKPATIALIAECSTDIWLIPADESPFDWQSFYGNDTYGPTFRTAFHDAYQRIEQRTHFDVYACRS